MSVWSDQAAGFLDICESLHKNHEKTLKIVTSSIRIWGIGIRIPKWSEYIRISDNSDIRTSTLVQISFLFSKVSYFEGRQSICQLV